MRFAENVVAIPIMGNFVKERASLDISPFGWIDRPRAIDYFDNPIPSPIKKKNKSCSLYRSTLTLPRHLFSS